MLLKNSSTIPYRDDKNRVNTVGTPVRNFTFQPLIGTIKTTFLGFSPLDLTLLFQPLTGTIKTSASSLIP